MKKTVIAVLLLTVITLAEENPYYSWEEFECYAEADLSCEELAEQWEEEHEQDEE